MLCNTAIYSKMLDRLLVLTPPITHCSVKGSKGLAGRYLCH